MSEKCQADRHNSQLCGADPCCVNSGQDNRAVPNGRTGQSVQVETTARSEGIGNGQER